MKNLIALLVTSTSLLACAESGTIEDSENDVFYTEDSKADGFGVEDWSPDGAAVLRMVSHADAGDLEYDVGLTERVSKNIVRARGPLGGKYEDLADLDDVPYVGTTVFKKLLAYANENELFKTSIRVPLVVGYGDTAVPLSSFNDEARAAGLRQFARFTFVDSRTDFSAKINAYQERLNAVTAAAGIELDEEMPMYASSLGDYRVGSLKPCYVGRGGEVADVAASQSDSMMSDMFIVWGWRFRGQKWIDENIENQSDLGSTYENWRTTRNEVLIIASATDDGDSYTTDIVAPCR